MSRRIQCRGHAAWRTAGMGHMKLTYNDHLEQRCGRVHPRRKTP